MISKGSRIVLMFPGQGSQYIHMGHSFLKNNKKYFKYFDIASSIIGQNLLDVVEDYNDKGRYLDNTQYSQIAIFTLSCAVNDFLFDEKGINTGSVVFATGHSLGDYSALYSCGAFSFTDGAELVSFRGKLMAEAGSKPQQRMSMAAVLGCDIDSIAKILESYKERVFIANINDYSQIVISGYADDIEKAAQEIKLCGAKRVVPLKVNIASHCPLMKEISVNLEKYLNDNFNDFNDFKINFFSATEVQEIKKGQVKKMLIDQLLNPVKWKDSIESIAAPTGKKLSNENVGKVSFIEVGPGKVLSGLVKRILSQNSSSDVEIFNTDSIDEIERISI